MKRVSEIDSHSFHQNINHGTPQAKLALMRAIYPAQTLNLCVNGQYQLWEYIDTGNPKSPDGYAQIKDDPPVPPLVWLPGAMGIAETSFYYILAFAEQFRVISLTYPETVNCVKDLVDGVLALLTALGVPKAHIHGGSYSGLIAQCLLRRAPHSIDHLILSQTGVPRTERARQYRKWLAAFTRLPMPVIQLAMKLGKYTFLYHRTPLQKFWRRYFDTMIDALSHQGLLNRLHVAIDFDSSYNFARKDLGVEWQGHILILEAAHDNNFPPVERAALRQLYPQAQVHLLPARQHLTSLEYPQEQIAIIRAFLASGCS